VLRAEKGQCASQLRPARRRAQARAERECLQKSLAFIRELQIVGRDDNFDHLQQWRWIESPNLTHPCVGPRGLTARTTPRRCACPPRGVWEGGRAPLSRRAGRSSGRSPSGCPGRHQGGEGLHHLGSAARSRQEDQWGTLEYRRMIACTTKRAERRARTMMVVVVHLSARGVCHTIALQVDLFLWVKMMSPAGNLFTMRLVGTVGHRRSVLVAVQPKRRVLRGLSDLRENQLVADPVGALGR
jgi:hypothetical protein